MTLPFNAYKDIGNKLLIVLSGLRRDAKITNKDDDYIYDKYDYKISKRFLGVRFSKSLSKQLLVYMLCSNSVGEINIISEQDIADEIGVSMRTVQHNNKILKDRGIIKWKRFFGDDIYVTLENYKEDFTGFEEIDAGNKGKVSTGYTKMKKETILQLCKEDDVNVLRAVLRFFAEIETQFNGVMQAHEVVLFFKDITNFLPTYVGYKAKINEILEKVQQYIPVEIIKGVEATKTFIKSTTMKMTEKVLSKAKDALIYLVNKDEHHPDRKKFDDDVSDFGYEYQSFLALIKSEELVNVDIRQLTIHRDDIGTLITSFGLNSLRVALDNLYDIMTRRKIYTDTFQRSHFSSKDYTYLNNYYFNPSAGIRFLASYINT